MIYVIGLGSNLDSKYGDQYQTLKKSIDIFGKNMILME